MFISNSSEKYKLPRTIAPSDESVDLGPNLIERFQASGVPDRTITPQYPGIQAVPFISKENKRLFGDTP